MEKSGRLEVCTISRQEGRIGLQGLEELEGLDKKARLDMKAGSSRLVSLVLTFSGD